MNGRITEEELNEYLDVWKQLNSEQKKFTLEYLRSLVGVHGQGVSANQ